MWVGAKKVIETARSAVSDWREMRRVCPHRARMPAWPSAWIGPFDPRAYQPGSAPERNASLRVDDDKTRRLTMMKAVALAFAVLASGTIVAMAQGVTIEVPGVKVTPPRVDIERRDRPIVEERRKIETEGRGSRGGCESKSVTKIEPGETKTVTKENCGGS
jgi:hypothetical protein